jgi:amino acid transporter
MASEKLGLTESVSIALGGMIGGGIFAVLGVVASTAHELAWLAFLVGGVIALCTGYSNVVLNDGIDGNGGPVTYIEQFTGRSTLAGMAGWTFIVGYVGTTAMYASAFGSYFVELVGVHTVAGLPLRPVVSVAVVATFVGLNLAGAHASGRTEELLVAAKVTILLVFVGGGLYYGLQHGAIHAGLSAMAVGPLVAAAISFVAFEGWELLLYDQNSIDDPKTTVRRAIYISIVVAALLYAFVALATTNLVSTAVIRQHSETALAVAAEPFLGTAGFVLISVAALLSTGSAINATLFSTARFSRRLVSYDLLPDQFSERDRSGAEPVRPLLVLGALAAAVTVVGSLRGIAAFASLTFIVIGGGMNYLALRERGRVGTSVAVAVIGLLGTVVTVPLLLYHLYDVEFGAFVTVIAISVAVVLAEMLYFEREWLVEEVAGSD